MAHLPLSYPAARPFGSNSIGMRLRSWTMLLAREQVLVLGLMVVALIAQGLNMFHYPSFTFLDDEGIYAEQAWAVLREHRLAPYTYWYDHAPGGWLLVAAWMALTGGVHTFGGAIDSGRMLMLLLHVAMVPLLYHLARKLGCGVPMAAFAVVLFSVSPLAIFYQRLFLLDNIMLFWVLLSLDLLLDGWGRLSRVALSGVCFGIALVSKETAVFLVPVLLFIAVQQRWRHQGKFGVAAWVVPMLVVLSWYPLFAILKGELLPAGKALGFILFNVGSTTEHTSLIEQLQWQATRGGGGLLNLQNLFWTAVRTEWVPRDPFLFVGGMLAIALNLVLGVRNRRVLVAGLLGLFPMVYLARGGLVFPYYVLFAIPFLCLNLAVLFNSILSRMPTGVAALCAMMVIPVLTASYWYAGRTPVLYREQPDRAGREAISWIKVHVPAQSLIVTRDDLWTDLHEAGLGGPSFPNVHSHWKVAADPEIRNGVFHNDWKMVDYLIMSPGVEGAFKDTNNALALEALHHAHLVKHWESDGSVVELWKVDKLDATNAMLMNRSAAYIDSTFAHDGAYMDADGSVTSESQAYGMLRAVWSGNRPEFDAAWMWTRTHLLNADGLLAWQWRGGAVLDVHSASDADSDMALALLMAGKRWNDPALIDEGTRMVQAIWQHEVTQVQNAPYVVAGDWVTNQPVLAWNPSYFAPYAYHIFKEVDPSHDWVGVIDTGYHTLAAASSAPLGSQQSAGLPPDWVGIDATTGELVPLQLPKGDSTTFSYDAARTYWRMALDLQWTGDGRAQSYLQQAGFLQSEVQRKGYPSAAYTHDGHILEEGPSLVGIAGVLAALTTLDSNGAQALYAAHIVGDSQPMQNGFAWGNGSDLYTQEWAWFATAFSGNSLTDLWHQSNGIQATHAGA